MKVEKNVFCVDTNCPPLVCSESDALLPEFVGNGLAFGDEFSDVLVVAHAEGIAL